MEYNETLYTTDSSVKPEKKSGSEIKGTRKRTSWENPRTIEQNIDTMKKAPSELSETCSQKDTDVDKKVDQILLKKKMKF
jgi:hypothetical protein